MFVNLSKMPDQSDDEMTDRWATIDIQASALYL